eukprot:GHVL01010627.1.p1 GENE.GHVL01010627.1~~GHVL01010627.1.p1  ORF type:complete len:274 (+),score=60.14 GHVL01010627.1:25-846(+)
MEEIYNLIYSILVTDNSLDIESVKNNIINNKKNLKDILLTGVNSWEVKYEKIFRQLLQAETEITALKNNSIVKMNDVEQSEVTLELANRKLKEERLHRGQLLKELAHYRRKTCPDKGMPASTPRLSRLKAPMPFSSSQTAEQSSSGTKLNFESCVKCNNSSLNVFRATPDKLLNSEKNIDSKSLTEDVDSKYLHNTQLKHNDTQHTSAKNDSYFESYDYVKINELTQICTIKEDLLKKSDLVIEELCERNMLLEQRLLNFNKKLSTPEDTIKI